MTPPCPTKILGAAVIAESFRRRTHPHVWVLNGPVVLWFAVDILCRKFSRRLGAPVGQKRHDSETCTSKRLSPFHPRKPSHGTRVSDTRMNGVLRVCRGGLALVGAHRTALALAIARLCKFDSLPVFGGRSQRGLFVFQLTADGPPRARLPMPPLLQRCRPACGHYRSPHLFPGSRLTNVCRDASSALLQPINPTVGFYANSCSHATESRM